MGSQCLIDTRQRQRTSEIERAQSLFHQDLERITKMKAVLQELNNSLQTLQMESYKTGSKPN